MYMYVAANRVHVTHTNSIIVLAYAHTQERQTLTLQWQPVQSPGH